MLSRGNISHCAVPDNDNSLASLTSEVPLRDELTDNTDFYDHDLLVTKKAKSTAAAPPHYQCYSIQERRELCKLFFSCKKDHTNCILTILMHCVKQDAHKNNYHLINMINMIVTFMASYSLTPISNVMMNDTAHSSPQT